MTTKDFTESLLNLIWRFQNTNTLTKIIKKLIFLLRLKG